MPVSKTLAEANSDYLALKVVWRPLTSTGPFLVLQSIAGLSGLTKLTLCYQLSRVPLDVSPLSSLNRLEVRHSLFTASASDITRPHAGTP
jgi:hypothetical protein